MSRPLAFIGIAFGICLLLAGLVFVLIQTKRLRNIANRNQQAVNALPAAAQVQVLREVQSSYGDCLLSALSVDETTWRKTQITLVRLQCQQLYPLTPQYRSDTPSRFTCVAMASHDSRVTVVHGDLHDGCKEFGEFLAHGNGEVISEADMREIVSLWELVAPSDCGPYDRKPARKHGKWGFGRNCNGCFEELIVHLDSKGRFLGTSYEFERIPGTYEKLEGSDFTHHSKQSQERTDEKDSKEATRPAAWP